MQRTRSRVVAVLLGMASGIGWLEYNNRGNCAEFVFLMLQPIVLGISGVIGGWTWLLWSRNANSVPHVRSWNHALLGWLVVLSPCLLLTGDGKWIFLDASSLSLSIYYIGGKLGCAALGCCDWLNEELHSHRTRRIRLPYLEASITMLSCVLAFALYVSERLPGILSAVLLGTHILVRAGFLPFRKGTQPTNAVQA